MNPKKPFRYFLGLIMAFSLVNPLIARTGQTTPADSLKQLLEHSEDTLRIDVLLALTEYLHSDDPQQAFAYGREALKLAQQKKDLKRSGLANQAIAGVYTVNALYDKALEYLFQAMKEYKSTHDTAEIARCQDDIGFVYLSAGEYDNAWDNFKAALELNKKTRNIPQIADNYMHMGTSLIKQDSIEKGLSYYTVSLLLADSLNMQKEQVQLLNDIGYGNARLGKYEDALKQFYKVIELVGRKPDDFTRATAMVNIARGYLSLKNYPAAMKYAQKGYDLATAKGLHAVTRDGAKVLSDIYAGQQNYRLAYQYLNTYKSMSDTVMNAEKSAQLARIQALYELDQKEQENISLKQENIIGKKSLRTRSLVILLITTLLVVLIVALYLLNRLNNKQLALNRKLVDQGKELESLNEQKDRFFSFVAHNLKNPFNTIMGFAELMQRNGDGRDPEKARQYAGLIYDLSSQVQKVLSNLLEWSRMQRRSFECRPEPFELNNLLKDVLEMNNREAARKDIHLNLTGHEHVQVSADRLMITTVVQNLLSNAITFTPNSGEITLNCSLRNNEAVVSVTDNGMGMSPEKLAKLFRFDFTQSRISASDKTGAGLGLIICHDIITRNSGTIEAESTLGKGSCFTFTLPAIFREQTPEEKDQVTMAEMDATAELLDEQKPLPANVVKSIVMNLTPLFEEVSRVLSIENLDEFAKALIETGSKLGIAGLTSYGRNLDRLTQAHQIDQIIKILPGFRKYLDHISNQAWS